jgi:transcriptional regulator with XRE-family HTH domain
MKNRIKEVRIGKRMTQKELSEKSNISERQIIRVENEKQNPSGITLVNIAAALETTVTYLLCECTERERPNIAVSETLRET